MKRMTEKRLAELILRLIDAHEKGPISNQLLDEVFDRRPDRPDDELKPLVDPFQERLEAFCTR